MELKISIKKIVRQLFKIARIKPNFLFLAKNKMKKIKKCYICGERFEKFSKYKLDKNSENITNDFQLIGSDIKNFSCYYCYCTDRDRHLFMFFDKLSFWDKLKNAKILHFAPETSFIKKIEQLSPKEYIKCDLFPKQDDWKKIDATKIDFQDNYFDIIICNHVIEHIPDYLQAFKEISRVLKKNGVAILQTPYSELLYDHFEDRNINTDKLRLLFYGQEDHVRIMSKRQLFDELSQYFTLDIVKNQSLFNDDECFKYGVNKKEDLIMVMNNKK